jgi:hypothetical protein
MSEIRKRIKNPAPDGWEQLAAAVREVRDQIRESFGPHLETREVGGMTIRGAAEDLDQIHLLKLEPREAGRFGGTGEMIGREDLDAIVEPTEARLKREIRDRVLDLCGFVDGGEVTADGSADNDLAHERADAVMDMLEKVRGHGFPQAVAPPAEGAPLYELLNALRPLVYRVVNATATDDAALTENVDVIMAFVNLAREHSDPKRLLPRGDRVGDWLPPGTEVMVLGQHRAVVMPARDMVTVKLDGSDVVTEFPRMSITREGEQWMPPKPTGS